MEKFSYDLVLKELLSVCIEIADEKNLKFLRLQDSDEIQESKNLLIDSAIDFLKLKDGNSISFTDSNKNTLIKIESTKIDLIISVEIKEPSRETEKISEIIITKELDDNDYHLTAIHYKNSYSLFNCSLLIYHWNKILNKYNKFAEGFGFNV